MDNRMRKILSSLIAILAVANLEAQPHAPKLVVCITVDQLRGDYIEYFYNTFGERGFKRLMNEGVVYNNIRFEFSNIDQASAFATLFTGSNPCFSGIGSNFSYDFDRDREVSILNDPEYLGNYTKENYSPKNLFSSTIGDELKIASGGRSDVYAVAPDPESAILSAGHAANGAFWMDNLNGKWATTTYYKGIPWYVDRYNNGPEALSARIASMVWTPSLSMDKLNAFPYVLDEIPYRYTFNEKAIDCYPRLKTSPYINKEVNRLAIQFLEYGGFGTRSCPDMLSVTYYAGNFLGTQNKEYTREIQDTYYQLDQDIEKLLDTIDKKVGLSNTLVVFTGSGYYKSEESYPDGLMVNGGEFHPKLDLATVQRKAADFLQEFSGVQSVTTDKSLLTGDWNEGTIEFRQGTHHLRRGDLLIELQPGWKLNFDNGKEQVKVIRNNAVITPLIFMGNGLKPQHIYREVKATEVAPTVTHVLRIRPPNASHSLPLYEIKASK